VVIYPDGLISRTAQLTVVPRGSFTPAAMARPDFWHPDGPVYAIVETNGILYLGGAFQNLRPPSGQGAWFDVFSGRADPAFPQIDGRIWAGIPDGRGGWFIGGEFYSVGGVSRTNLVHILDDKTVDPAWQPVLDGPVGALLLADGVLYFGGLFSHVNSQSRTSAAAVDANTGLLTLWNPALQGFPFGFNPAAVYSLALSEDVIFTGGDFATVAGVNKTTGARVGTDISVRLYDDVAWTAGNVYALAVADMTLFIGGSFNDVNSQTRTNVAAVDLSTRQVKAWHPDANGSVLFLTPFCNTVLAGGFFTAIAGQPRNRLAALDPVSTAATSWNPDLNGAATALAVAGSTIYVGGQFTAVANQPRNYLAAVDGTSGQVAFWTPAADRNVGGLAVAGGLVFAGGQDRSTAVRRNNVAALDAVTGQPTPWDPDASAAVYALAPTAGTIYLGGNFVTVHDQPRSGLAAVDAVLGNLTSWAPRVDQVVRSLTLASNVVYVGGEFLTVNGVSRSHLAALDASTGELTDWNPAPQFMSRTVGSSYVNALLATPDLLYVAGDVFTIAGQSRVWLGAVTSLGTLTPWNPIADPASSGEASFVSALVPSGNRLYIGGSFIHDGTNGVEDYYHLAAFDVNTGAQYRWNLAPISQSVLAEHDAYVNALALSGNIIYAGGYFGRIGGQPRLHLAALDYLSGNALTWNPSPNSEVISLAALESGLAVGGWFTTIGGRYRPYFAMFPRQGSPLIVQQPAGQTVPRGGTATFTVVASGVTPLSYQWRFNATDLPGAGAPTLVVENAQLSSAGTYTVVIRNRLGELASAPVELIVVDSVVITNQPASQTIAPGSDVTLSVGATAAPPPNYQWRLNGVNIPGAVFPTFTVANAQPTNGGSYSVVVFNGRDALESRVAELIVTAPPLPFADNFASRGTISGASGLGSGSNAGASREPGETNHVGKAGGRSVWLRWVAPASGIATFSTRGSGFDTLLAIYRGTDIANLAVATADEDRGGFLTSQAAFNAVAATEYSIAVDGFAGASGNILLSWSLDTTTVEFPRILNQPVSRSAFIGQEVTFEVDVTSPTPESYQWYRDCLAIAGATNRTLTIANVQLAEVGNYQVAVMNASTRAAESVPAALEIGPEPKVLSQDKLEDLFNAPLAQTSARFAQAASSSSGFLLVSLGTIDSQALNNTTATTSLGETNHCGVLGGASKWLEIRATADGVMRVDTIGSAIDTVLAVYTGTDLLSIREVACDNNSAPDGIGSLVRFDAYGGTDYLLAVDGVNGAKGAINLNWKLGLVPRVTASSTNQTLRLGEGAVLFVNATSPTPDLTFEWRLDGRRLSGATNATLDLGHVQPSQSGLYQVVVRNFAGGVTNTIGQIRVALPIRLGQSLVASNQTAYFRLSGPLSQSYLIQGSTNLWDWRPLYTNTSVSAELDFWDAQSPLFPGRFYRVIPWE